MDWFKIGKRLHQGCILSPCLFNLHVEYIMQCARLDEAHAWIKIAGRITNNLRYASDTILVAESAKELKNLWMKVKEESEKAELKLNIQKMKIMAFGSITSWPIFGKKMETLTDFIFLGSKINTGGDCSHEIKRCLFIGRKALTNLDSVLQSRDITLPTKVCIVKAMVLPVVMFGCERWNIKKAKHQRTAAFNLWCWRRLLQIPCIGDQTNQLQMFSGRMDAGAEVPILRPSDAKSWHTGKDPDAWKDWGQEKKGKTEDEMVGWHHPFNGHEFEQTLGESAVHGVAKSQRQLSDRTTKTTCCPLESYNNLRGWRVGIILFLYKIQSMLKRVKEYISLVHVSPGLEFDSWLLAQCFLLFFQVLITRLNNNFSIFPELYQKKREI